MLRILIVDDEELIRKGIAGKIRRFFPEAEIVGSTGDPHRAIEIAKDVHPNLVITDIRMPEMDGLELIENLSGIYNDIKFILVSGYQEFEYARKAIEMNVENYLLKPIDNEKFKAIIQKIQEKIDQESAEKKYLQELKVRASDSLIFLKNKYLTDLIYHVDKRNIDSTLNALEKIGVKFEDHGFLVITILFENKNLDDDAVFRTALPIEDIAAGVFNGYGKTVGFNNIKKEDEVVLIINRPRARSSSRTVGSDILSLCHTLLDQLRVSLDTSFSIGIGKCYNSPYKIPDSYSESYSAAIQKIIVGDNQVIDVENLPHFNEVTFFIPEEQKLMLISYINTNDKENALLLIDRIFSVVKKKGVLYKTLKTMYLDLSLTLGKAVKEAGGSLENIFSEDIFSDDFISRYTTLEELKAWLKKCIVSICNYLKELRESDGKKVIKEVVNYINNYYYLDINLHDLAKKYYLNPSYLSHLFKAEVGENFIDYLKRIRIEKAKHLLANTTLKTYQVGEMVGYTNSRYFSNVFMKVVGLTPSEFREQNGSKRSDA